MLCPSRINPNMLVYEAVHSPYDWNWFPLATPGCKAVIYESLEALTLWGSWGINTWYIRLTLNHYQCNNYFVPETRAFLISGSAELYPQHCEVPFLMWNEHPQEVIHKFVTTLQKMPPEKCNRVLTLVAKKLATGQLHNPKHSFTYPGHEWILHKEICKGHHMIPPANKGCPNKGRPNKG
jgi:hypothetical protein